VKHYWCKEVFSSVVCQVDIDNVSALVIVGGDAGVRSELYTSMLRSTLDI